MLFSLVLKKKLHYLLQAGIHKSTCVDNLYPSKISITTCYLPLNFNQDCIKIFGSVNHFNSPLWFILQPHCASWNALTQVTRDVLIAKFYGLLLAFLSHLVPNETLGILQTSLFGFCDSLSFCIPPYAIHFLHFFLSEMCLDRQFSVTGSLPFSSRDLPCSFSWSCTLALPSSFRPLMDHESCASFYWTFPPVHLRGILNISQPGLTLSIQTCFAHVLYLVYY